MKLQHFDVLKDYVRCSAILFISDELLIALYNVTQLVSEIVLKIQLGHHKSIIKV